MAKSSARQFLVKIVGVEGMWATKQGGSVSSDTTPVYDGGQLKPDLVAAPPVAEDITVSRIFDPARDDEALRQLLQLCGAWTTTISVTPTDANMVAVAPPRVYSNALLKGVNEPEVDAASGDPAPWGLVFAVPDWR